MNTTFKTLLPNELKENIKTVNKISDSGEENNSTLITTQDDLFLLSVEEIGLNSSYITAGQGDVYEYYLNPDNIKKTFYTNSNYWWLRSTKNNNTYGFWYVRTADISDPDYGNPVNPLNVYPCFCI